MKNKTKSIFFSDDLFFGFRLSNLLGIVVMIIPFIISIRFNHIIPGRKIWFLQLIPDEVTTIRPGLVSALCAVVFYAALIVRYNGIFRANNLMETFVSIARAFLNCWVIAALISLVIPTNIPKNATIMSVLRDNPESTLLMFAIVLSWLGMRAIAGYSWILFILSAWKHLLIVNSAMNMWGAVFILAFAISLFLQIKDYSNISDFAQEFRNIASHMGRFVKEDINAAAEDASQKVQAVGNFVKDNTSMYTNVKFPSSSGESKQRSEVKINLEALDLNKDGVVDEKDFQILNQEKK